MKSFSKNSLARKLLAFILVFSLAFTFIVSTNASYVVVKEMNTVKNCTTVKDIGLFLDDDNYLVLPSIKETRVLFPEYTHAPAKTNSPYYDLDPIAELLGYTIVIDDNIVFINNDGNKAISIKVSGANVIYPDLNPIYIDDQLMVPIRTMESLGYEVTWNDGQVTVANDEIFAVLTTGSKEYTINGEKFEMAKEMTMIEDRNLVDIESLVKAFGYDVEIICTDTLDTIKIF